MSGGVDSAVAAFLLKEKGFNVIGVFMKNWSDEEDLESQCTAKEDFDDVQSVCSQIDIPYYNVNFEQEYMDRVFTYFLNEYKKGRTPNPDVLCNSEIKFKAFLNFALKTGAKKIATGHYVRTEINDDKVILKKGVDVNKDQSYFLCLLNQYQLKNSIFPIGNLNKNEVRKIAKVENFKCAEKKDSTGLCFIGERNFKNFLQNYLPALPGDIKTIDGRTIGEHCGLMYYTIGQRRGLNIGGLSGSSGERWFVIEKDLTNNILYVSQGAESEELYNKGLIMKNFHPISGEALPKSLICFAKIRYRQPDQKAIVTKTSCSSNDFIVEFEKKQRAITPGQYCVLYDGDICLGGGIIEKSI